MKKGTINGIFYVRLTKTPMHIYLLAEAAFGVLEHEAKPDRAQRAHLAVLTMAYGYPIERFRTYHAAVIHRSCCGGCLKN
jgi:hypothetical protein